MGWATGYIAKLRAGETVSDAIEPRSNTTVAVPGSAAVIVHGHPSPHGTG
jgi:hypothetical protein